MKRMIKKVVATVVALAIAVTLTAGFAPAKADAAKGVTVKSVKVKSPKSKKLALKVGQKSTIKVTVSAKPNKAANKKVKYSTNKKTVAKVNKKGVVTAVGVGKAKITVASTKNKKKKATVTVTVSKATVVPTATPKATVAPTKAPTASPTVAPIESVKPSPTEKPVRTPNPNDITIDLSKKTSGSTVYDAETGILKNKTPYTSDYQGIVISLTEADLGADFDINNYTGVEVLCNLIDDEGNPMPSGAFGMAQVKVLTGSGWDADSFVYKYNLISEEALFIDFWDPANYSEQFLEKETDPTEVKLKNIVIMNSAKTCTVIEIVSIKLLAKD